MKIRSLNREDPFKEERATHLSILSWKIPWTEETSRLQSIGLQRVRHNWVANTQCIWKSLRHVRLFVTPWTVVCQVSLSREFSRPGYWVPFSRGSSQSRDQTQVSHISGRFFTTWATREVVVYLCQAKSPNSSHPSLFPSLSVCPFSVSVSLFLLWN